MLALVDLVEFITSPRMVAATGVDWVEMLVRLVGLGGLMDGCTDCFIDLLIE